MSLPFIQDDWGWIFRFETQSAATVLKSIFTFKGALFYRPLAGLYLFAMYRLFGANPVPFHMIALLLHFAGACLVIAVVRRVTGDEIISYMTGFIYALAAAVVLEPLLWAVGIFDVGASFFFLLAILLFIRERPAGSAIAYLAGCLFKEPVIILPVILMVYAVVMTPRSRAPMMKRLLPMASALGVMIIVKLMGMQPNALPAAHPYHAGFLGYGFLRPLFQYSSWLIQSFDPLVSVETIAAKHILAFCEVVFIVVAFLVSWPHRETAVRRPFWFLLGWFLVAIAPVMLFPKQEYRYYAMYALPAFVSLVLIQVGVLVRSVRLGRRLERALVLLVACSAVILSMGLGRQMLREGLSQRTLIDGTNRLIRRAALVEIVRKDLPELLPAPPRGAVIVLHGVDLSAFDTHSGPRVWYRNASISVYPFKNLKYDGRGPYIENAARYNAHAYTGEAFAMRRVDPAKLFAFGLDGDRLRPITLKAIAAPQAGNMP